MSQEDRESIGHYKAVARGWWYVGAGAWFIFLKEAWELAEHRGVDGPAATGSRWCS